MNTSEQAKFYKDKHILETQGHHLADGTPQAKATAMAIGISPENYDKIVGKPDNEVALEEMHLQLGIAYDELIKFVDSYMDIPLDKLKMLAVWQIGTYFHEYFETYPYLFLNAMRGSGKTRLLKILSHVCAGANCQVNSGITESILFRTPKHHTLIIDEFENVGSKEKATLREYLNASYKAGGVVKRSRRVKKNDGEGYEIETFEPFKPIVMANIWGMDEVVGDRCLTFVLEKSFNPAKVKKIENFKNETTLKNLITTLKIKGNVVSVVKSSCGGYIQKWNNYIDSKYNNTTTHNTIPPYNYTKLHQNDVEDNDFGGLEDMFLAIDESGVDGRNLELLFPLLITARLISYDVFKEILRIGSDMLIQKVKDEMMESKDVMLIEFISKQPSEIEYLSISDLSNKFKTFVGNEEQEDKWINAKWMGRALKRLNLILESKRVAKGQLVILNVAKALEIYKLFENREKSATLQGGSHPEVS